MEKDKKVTYDGGGDGDKDDGNGGDEDDEEEEDEEDEEEEDDDDEDEEEDEDEEDSKGLRKRKGTKTMDMSFYKLRWFTYRNYKEDNVQKVIEENFHNDNLSLKWKDNGSEYGGFHIHLYRRTTETNSAKIIPSVETELNIKHDDLIFFFTDNINPKYVFCLCSGHSYRLLEGHTESDFNKTMAKHFMDGYFVTSKNVICIAGPSISEHLTFSPEAKLLINGNYEKITTGLTARIREETELAKIICCGKPVSMTLGLKKLQIHKKLDLETFSQVFKLFIEAHENSDRFPMDPILVAALDYTQYIGNPVFKKKLEEKLMKDAKDPDNSKRVYLHHKRVEDWAHSSDIKIRHGKKTIHRFTLAPTLDVLRENDILSFDEIQIVFTAKDQTKVKGCLDTFLHGSTMFENKQYHKVAGKWYWLSPQYHRLLQNRMSIFLKNHLIKQGETGYLPLPWKPKSLPNTGEAFKFLSHISPKRLNSLLNGKVRYLGKEKKSCLSGLNCKFINTGDGSVYADLYKCLSQPKDKGKKTSVSSMMSGLEHAMMVSAKEGRPLSDCIQSCPIEKEAKEALQKHQEEIISILRTSWNVCVSEKVANPNVTKGVSRHIFKQLPKDIITENCTLDVIGKEVFCYLRTSCKQIAEGDYNETYQSIPEKDDRSFYMLGDRVQGKRLPELFDILYYKVKEPAKLYLYHVKEGFGQKTRDACSQIRVSANLLWHDLMDSSCNLPNVMKYRTLALEYKGTGICKILLKEAMEKMPEEKFKSMFREVSEIVYVYAFMDNDKKDGYLDNVSSLKKLTKEIVGVDELDKLKKEGYVDRDETLTDSFFLTTQDSFMKQMKGKLEVKQLEVLFKQLSELTEPVQSTIALVELTTLAEEFIKFQCHARRFSLKVCQISTCST